MNNITTAIFFLVVMVGVISAKPYQSDFTKDEKPEYYAAFMNLVRASDAYMDATGLNHLKLPKKLFTKEEYKLYKDLKSIAYDVDMLNLYFDGTKNHNWNPKELSAISFYENHAKEITALSEKILQIAKDLSKVENRPENSAEM